MKAFEICVVKVTRPGAWPAWYFAHILECDDDGQGNWEVNKFQVIGEPFARDSYEGLFVIREADKQAAAKKLAEAQWGPKSYNKTEDVRTAILEKLAQSS